MLSQPTLTKTHPFYQKISSSTKKVSTTAESMIYNEFIASNIPWEIEWYNHLMKTYPVSI